MPVGSEGVVQVSAPGYVDEQQLVRCDKEGLINRIVLLRLSGAAQGKTESFCSVTVRTTDAQGQPMGTVVDLLLGNKSVSRSYGDEKGIARFCDLGPGEYRIRVGGGSCNAMEIAGVRDRYPRETNYAVTLTPCSEGADRGLNVCPVYFRVSSETGEPLPYVIFQRDDRPPVLTDRYGRAYDLIRFDSTATFLFSSKGYTEERVTLDCQGAGTRKVVLKRRVP
jgi:hypothetical protein